MRSLRLSWLSGVCVAAVLPLFSGCSSNSSPATASRGVGSTQNGSEASTLSIISPHPPVIQAEFSALWKTKHPNIELKWMNQGGSSDDLKFVRDQFATFGKEKGIGVDIFFGGGGETFAEMEKDGLLVPLSSNYQIPDQLNGVPLRAQNNLWVAAALSGFGMLYNKQIAARDKLPVPQTWGDLANPKLRERIQLADPRHSGSAHTIYEIILQTNGWDKGWKILTAMAGNARSWAQSSSAPLQDVQNGEAVFCTAIDFYAQSIIAQVGSEKLGYIEPKGQYIITADPIALLQNGPNPEAAKKFVDMVMSPEGQKLWFLPKGAPGGPKENELFRLPALPSVYRPIPKGALVNFDPYTLRTTAPYNSEKSAQRRRPLDELIGTVLVDNHDAIKAAWKAVPNLEKTGYVPISEAEFMKLAAKWNDPKVSSSANDKWSAQTRARFN